MTKADLIKALDGLDDDAIIYVQTPADEYITYTVVATCDKVIDKKLQNEITLIGK